MRSQSYILSCILILISTLCFPIKASQKNSVPWERLYKIKPNETERMTPADVLGPELSRDGATWSARIDDVASELPRLLDRVRDAGCRVVHLDVRRPGLTEVFMSLTGKDLRE